MGPLIGVMPLYDEDRDSIWLLPGYQDLIEQNGGIPLILPLTTNKETLRPFLSICSGFLFRCCPCFVWRRKATSLRSTKPNS